MVRRAADFQFVRELGEFDAAADVGERIGNLVVFQDYEFLLGWWGRGFDRELSGGRGGNVRDYGRALLLGDFAGFGLGRGLLVLAGIIEVGGE